jgi:hypothetical protein
MENLASPLTQLLPLLLLAACGQQSTPVAARTITGTCLFTFWSDDGSTTTYAGCANTEITSSGLDGAGLWEQLSSTVLGANGFSVPAPAGDCLLGVKYPNFAYWEFFETSMSTFALGANVVARPNAVIPTQQTVATFSLDGFDPWDVNDFLELTSSGGGTFSELVSPFGGGNVVPMGATSAVVSFDWYGSGSRLPDGTQGDIVYVHQVATLPLPGADRSYQTATRFVSLPPTLAVANGTTQSVTATLGPVAQTGSLSLDWRTSSFEQHQAEINPNATGIQHALRVDANPHSLSNRPHLEPGSPDMLVLSVPPGTLDLTLDEIPYGQFLPQFWVEYRLIFFTAGLSVTAPGAFEPGLFIGGIGRYDPLPDVTGPVTPVVTPPLSPEINGLDAFAGPAGVGTSPTVSWSPPAIGAPTSYVVLVSQPVESATGGTTFLNIAYITTTGTSVSVPPGLLEPGVTYVAAITADMKNPDTSESAPYQLSYPYAYASAIVAFTP